MKKRESQVDAISNDVANAGQSGTGKEGQSIIQYLRENMLKGKS
jgi:hypothetical protein